MLKALLKKQFLELNVNYYQNRKTGKKRSAFGIIAMVILFVFVFFCLGFVFYGMADMLAQAFIPNYIWLYFSIFSLLSVVIGILCDAFNTYMVLYNAKDNDFLLSMPVSPSKLLLVRLFGIYALGLLYECIVLVPAVIVYWVHTPAGILNIIFPILIILLTGVIVLVFSCLIGFGVSLIAGKVKNKSLATVAGSLLFLAAYYFFYFKLNTFLASIVSSPEKTGNTVKRVLYPFYVLGRAYNGEVIPMLIVFFSVAALFLLTYYILSATYIKIATTDKGNTNKAVYIDKKAKVSSVRGALAKKEFKKFVSSPVYLLNTGLGLVFAIALAVVAVIKRKALGGFVTMISAMFPDIADLIPAAVIVVIFFLLSLNAISAPSISLEGKSLWILQSLPVNASEVLLAKLIPHTVLNSSAAVICTLVLGFVLKSDWQNLLFSAVLLVLFCELTAILGLFYNLKYPNLNWTNEAIPVKQGMSVLFSILSGPAIAVIFALGAYFLRNYISVQNYIIVWIVIFAIACRLLNKWLITSGAKIFEKL